MKKFLGLIAAAVLMGTLVSPALSQAPSQTTCRALTCLGGLVQGLYPDGTPHGTKPATGYGGGACNNGELTEYFRICGYVICLTGICFDWDVTAQCRADYLRGGCPAGSQEDSFMVGMIQGSNYGGTPCERTWEPRIGIDYGSFHCPGSWIAPGCQHPQTIPPCHAPPAP